jgi:GT2 family glycosyltransferase
MENMNDQTKELMINELLCLEKCHPETVKDILIVIKDQFEYVQKCLNSIFRNTENFHLFLWDNASETETMNYLQELAAHHSNVHLCRSEENLGFIIPNNRLAGMGQSPFLVLLNSDTVVRDGWDRVMLGFLQENQDVALVGYQGDRLNAHGIGVMPAKGEKIDCLQGWALALSRGTYDTHGLFDEEHLTFAYGEDADLCLRLKEKGLRIYSLYTEFIHHYKNKTARTVDRKVVGEHFKKNHAYLQERWKDYLEEKRVLKGMEVEPWLDDLTAEEVIANFLTK